MKTKSIIIGIALLVVGALIGYFVSRNCCPMNYPAPCNKEMVGQHQGMKPHCEMGEKKCGNRFKVEVLEKLNLTADQQTKIDEIMVSKRDAVKAEKQKADAAIKAVLTPEQQKQFDELVAKCCPMRGDCPRNPECKKQGGEQRPCCKK